MKDPHVVALTYRLVPGPKVEFNSPPPLDWETEAFRLRLEGRRARVEMKEHYASVQEARERVQPFLRAWEVSAALLRGHTEIRFEFESPEVIDRNPPAPGEPHIVCAEGTTHFEIVMRATDTVVRRTYPEPPTGFFVSPDVETMWARYRAYAERREPLGSMAYACLTLLEASAGGREQAAQQYGISRNVLDTLARLSTEVGDEQAVRKFTTKMPRPHTGAEVAWIETAVRALVRRAGEWAADPAAARPMITMADLPRL